VLSQSKTATAFVLAKNEQAGAAGAVVVFAFASTPEDVPGPYSVNMLSKVDMAKSFRMGETGSVMAEETWDFSTEGGDQLHFSMTFERGAGRRSHTETRVYSAAKPDFYRIYKADLVTDLVRGATGDAGRVKKIEFRASGPHLSPVFNGTERMIGITSDPAYYRQIFLPD
jgi:hypothetical protein